VPPLQNIRAITLDVGGTLIRPWPSVGHIYSEVAARFGHPVIPPETLNRQFASAWRAKRDFDHSRHAWQELVQKSFTGLLPESAVGGFFSELYKRFAQPDAWHVFEEVRGTLDALHERGVKLGIVSNWDERLRPLLDRLKLASWFSAIVISIEVGVPKPSRIIFDRAAALLGIAPGSILHIGDSLKEDVAGARAAGFQAMHLDRNGRTDSDSAICRLDSLARVALFRQ